MERLLEKVTVAEHSAAPQHEEELYRLIASLLQDIGGTEAF